MAFRLPEFPITCDVYTGPWLTKVFRSTIDCNLAQGRRGTVLPDEEITTSVQKTGPMYVLFPPLADVRSLVQGIPHNDLLELPSGSGRWYIVLYVDDVAKGFANEHRYAMINQVSENLDFTNYAGLNWPIPMP